MAKRPIKPGGPAFWVVTFKPGGREPESFWVGAVTEHEARARACRVSGNRAGDITNSEKSSSVTAPSEDGDSK